MRTGSGKTTTLRMLLGLVTPASSTARIGGRPYRRWRPKKTHGVDKPTTMRMPLPRPTDARSVTVSGAPVAVQPRENCGVSDIVPDVSVELDDRGAARGQRDGGGLVVDGNWSRPRRQEGAVRAHLLSAERDVRRR
jgi:energy-coupling factor transporter ATP-binding protein EcfA2